jgi:hypothetical protein
MNKSKILLASICIPVFFLALIPTSILYGATINPTATADQANYAQQLRNMYSGYNTAGAGNQSGLSTTVGGCIGSFVGNWVAGKTAGTLKSMFASKATALATEAVSSTVRPVPTLSALELAEQKSTTAELQSANYRDETLNGLAFCIGNGLIDTMSNSIVQWINTGFKNPDGTSGPAFLSNPGRFFSQMADREVGNFFQSLGPIGNIVCKPFDLQIRLALMNDYNRNNQYQQCTLTSIKQNFSNFGNGGDYMQDWFHLTQEDNNNAIGSYFIARQKLSEGIVYSVEQNKLEINLGKGFLSFKRCKTYDNTKKDLNTGKPPCVEWETITPGSEVQESLNRAMGSKNTRIEIATNFNQIVSALVSQVVMSAMNGLRNSSSNNRGNTNGGASLSEIIDQLNGTGSDETVSADNYYTLTASIIGTEIGSITGLDNPYKYGKVATLTAVPLNSTSTFIGWTSGCTTISGNVCNVFMDSNKTVVANFDSPTPTP